MTENNLTLTEKLKQVSEKTPDKIALQIKPNDTYHQHTYRELFEQSQSIAKSLISFGVGQRDRVAIILENRPEWSFIYFGILFAGAIAVPIDPQSTEKDITYYFKNSECKICFTSSTLKQTIFNSAKPVKTLNKIVLLDADEKSDKNTLFFEELLNETMRPLDAIKIEPCDIASILYTSGTTGKPKGVMLTHQNFYANFESIDQLNIFDPSHNILSILPLHHSFPFMATLLIPLFSHAKITYLKSLKREEILTCMQETNVTILAGVPQLFYLFHQTLLQSFKKIPFFIRWPLQGLSSLLYQLQKITHLNLNKILLSKLHKSFGKKFKYFVCGGATLDKDTELFFNKLGFKLIQGYGLTETSPIVTFNPIDKPKIGSVGKVIPQVNVRIVDPDEHGIGEITIRGPTVMQGYYQRPAETQAVLKDDWFYSGDLGYMDKEGYLFLTGRKKELIILGTGKNISPEEVENYYIKNPYIKELCVLSIGKDKEEKLAAVIVPDFETFKKMGELNIENLIKWEVEAYSKNYPEYKRIMKFILAKESLPRTRLGKLKRYAIKEKYIDSLLGETPTRTIPEEISEEERQLLTSPIYKTITKAIQQTKQLKQPIQLHDHLGIDLGFDSLTRIELASSLEKQLNIAIQESMMADITTAKELIIAIKKLLEMEKPSIKPSEKTWETLLKTDPLKNISDRLDIHPSLFSKTFDLLFCNSLYAIAKILWRVKIVGTENLPKNQPFILCPNHTSYLDAFLIALAVPSWLKVSIFFLGYRVYFDIPIARHLVKTGKIIPFDPATQLIDAMQACSYVLRNKKYICIFPEGGRSPDGSIKPFKKGVGILAHELNIPLIPVHIDGAFTALPRGKNFPSFNQITITFGKPCSPETLKDIGATLQTGDDYALIARGIQQKVEDLKQ